MLLSALADIRFSGVNKISHSSETPVRLCNYTDVYKNDYITADMEFMRATATPAEIARFGLRVGDVIITKDSETPDDIGVPAVVDSSAPDVVCGYHLALIRPTSDKVDPTFLAKQLGHHRLLRYFGQQANGSTRYGLSAAAISNAEVWLPRPPAQSTISRILRALDEAIAKTESLIEKLQRIRVGLLQDLLVRGLDEHGELRDPVSHPDEFQNSPAGIIPASWRSQTLGEAGEWFSGGTPSRSQLAWWKGDVPFLTPKDMKQFEIYDTIEHISNEAASLGSRLMPAGTLFIVVRGMILAHTFPVCLSARPVAFNQDMKALRAREGLSNRFLAHWFLANAHVFLRKATEATHGTKKLDTPELQRIVVGVPPAQEQDAIVDRLEAHDRLVSLEEGVRDNHRAIKDGLTSDLLSGRMYDSDLLRAGETPA